MASGKSIGLNGVTYVSQKVMVDFGFRDLCAFNDAMLAKQLWRLLCEPHSLCARIFQARYYPGTSPLEANLGARPSYVWRSLWGAREALKLGLRWGIGNGDKVRVWEDPWLPRPYSFKPISTRAHDAPSLKVSDLIDKEAGEWRLEVMQTLFDPANVEIIRNIPLCNRWPDDRVVWQYTPTGCFTVRSAYHLIMEQRDRHKDGSSSSSKHVLWKRLWQLDIPPRIKNFGWRAISHALPTGEAVARRVDMGTLGCQLCGATEDTDLHALLYCPWACGQWERSGWDESLWSKIYTCVWDWWEDVWRPNKVDDFGAFLAAVWGIWIERCKILYDIEHEQDELACANARKFVARYREANAKTIVSCENLNAAWTPPPSGVWKLNVDAGKCGEWGYGWGMTVRDTMGDIVMVAVHQTPGKFVAELEEAKALLFGLRLAWEAGYRSLIAESDCLSLISKLKHKQELRSPLGYIIDAILEIATAFDFISWSHVRREGNCVAHSIARLQPIELEDRIWFDDMPMQILELGQIDMCNYLAKNQ